MDSGPQFRTVEIEVDRQPRDQAAAVLVHGVAGRRVRAAIVGIADAVGIRVGALCRRNRRRRSRGDRGRDGRRRRLDCRRPAAAEPVTDHRSGHERTQLQVAEVMLAAVRLDLGLDVDPAQVERSEPVPGEQEVDASGRRRADGSAEMQLVRLLAVELGEVDAGAEVWPPASVRIEVVERAERQRHHVGFAPADALECDVGSASAWRRTSRRPSARRTCTRR